MESIDTMFYGTVQLGPNIEPGQPVDAFSTTREHLVIPGGARRIMPVDTNVFDNRLPIPDGMTFWPRRFNAVIVRLCRPPWMKEIRGVAEHPTLLDEKDALSAPPDLRIQLTLSRIGLIRFVVDGRDEAETYIGGPSNIDFLGGVGGCAFFKEIRLDNRSAVKACVELMQKVPRSPASDQGRDLEFLDLRIRLQGILEPR